MGTRLKVCGVVVGILAAGAATITAASAVGSHASSTGETSVSGGSVLAVKMFGEGGARSDGVQVSGPNWKTIPGANIGDGTVLRVTFTVPTGRRVYFRATLSGDAKCFTPTPGEGTGCLVRIVVNGNSRSMQPQTSDFGTGTGLYAPSIFQAYTPSSYPAGTYTITAQASTDTGGALSLETDLLTVDEIAAS